MWRVMLGASARTLTLSSHAGSAPVCPQLCASASVQNARGEGLSQLDSEHHPRDLSPQGPPGVRARVITNLWGSPAFTLYLPLSPEGPMGCRVPPEPRAVNEPATAIFALSSACHLHPCSPILGSDALPLSFDGLVSKWKEPNILCGGTLSLGECLLSFFLKAGTGLGRSLALCSQGSHAGGRQTTNKSSSLSVRSPRMPGCAISFPVPPPERAPLSPLDR